MKRIPGAEGIPIWMRPDPYYGPKDQAQDIRGKEMELKYVGVNLRRLDKFMMEQIQKQVTERLKEENKPPATQKPSQQKSS